VIDTSAHGRVGVPGDHAAAALEVMSRFALDPRWLIYLPPTMSPVATSAVPGLLEHPAEAFDAYRAYEVDQVVPGEADGLAGCAAGVSQIGGFRDRGRRSGVDQDRPALPLGDADVSPARAITGGGCRCGIDVGALADTHPS
jgi:hypothetical protein